MESVKLTIDDKEEVFYGETKAEAQAKMHTRIGELQAEFRKKHEHDEERPADGVRGFFLYSPVTERHFFRVYDPVDKRVHTDYKVCAEDIEVELLAGGLALYRNAAGEHRLDWSSDVLGRPRKT